MSHAHFLIFVCTLLLFAPPSVRAEDKLPEAPKTATLTAEQEEAVKTFLIRMREARERLWQKELTKKLDEFKNYGLRDDRRKSLTDAAEKSFAATIGPWSAAYEKFIRENWLKPQDDAALQALVERLPKFPDSVCETRKFTDAPNPFDRAVWRATIRFALGDEAFAKWQEAEAGKDAEHAAALAEAIQKHVDDITEAWKRDVDLKISELGSALTLQADQLTALQNLGKRLLDEAKEPLRKGLRKTMAGQKVQDLKNVLIGRVRYSVDDVPAPATSPAWKEGITKIIGEAGMKQLAAADADRRARRIRAFGLLLVSQMDARVALTIGQRERLQPLAEKLVEKDSTLVERDPNNYFNVSPDLFINVAAKAKAEDLQPILDAVQLARWQQACTPETRKQAQLDEESDTGQAPIAKSAAPKSPAAQREQIEQELSRFFIGKADAKRRDWVTAMQVKAEDLARTGKLPADKAARLEFAARGAVERTLATWSNSVETVTRSSVSNLDPRLLQQRLANMSSYELNSRNADADPEKNEFWIRALESLATEAQIAAWKKEIEERQKFEQDAVTQYLMAEFDLLARLTPAQWKALEPKLAESMRKNGPSIQRMFGYSSRQRPWFLLSYCRMVPFHGVPEKEMKETLTKAQWDRWSESNEFTNSAMYWSNIEQMNQVQIRAK